MLGSLGHQVSAEQLIALYGGASGPVTALALINLAETLGFAAKGYVATISELQRLRAPAILHWNRRHFVVFDRYESGRYLIANPSTGFLVWGTEAFVTRSFSGTLLIVGESM